jgi:hypothetical protein
LKNVTAAELDAMALDVIDAEGVASLFGRY